ncbi:hypothetical protein WH43_00035 [Rheinheimera sp. KL1]|nr:hypothetical protein WH43_00035 [Rheinheimera sp. KL1]
MVRKKKLSNNAIKTLYRSTDIHAFTCWIAFTLELIDHDNPQMMDAIQLSAIQHLLKMTLATPFAAIAEDLYLYLHHQFQLYFHRHANPFHYVLIYYKPDREGISLPLRLISNYCVSIKPTLELYEELYRRAIQTGIVTESHQERITFFNFIRHTEIQELSDILYQSKNHPSD